MTSRCARGEELGEGSHEGDGPAGSAECASSSGTALHEKTSARTGSAPTRPVPQGAVGLESGDCLCRRPHRDRRLPAQHRSPHRIHIQGPRPHRRLAEARRPLERAQAEARADRSARVAGAVRRRRPLSLARVSGLDAAKEPDARTDRGAGRVLLRLGTRPSRRRRIDSELRTRADETKIPRVPLRAPVGPIPLLEPRTSRVAAGWGAPPVGSSGAPRTSDTTDRPARSVQAQVRERRIDVAAETSLREPGVAAAGTQMENLGTLPKAERDCADGGIRTHTCQRPERCASTVGLRRLNFKFYLAYSSA